MHSNVINFDASNWVALIGICKTFSISFEKKNTLAHTSIVWNINNTAKIKKYIFKNFSGLPTDVKNLIISKLTYVIPTKIIAINQKNIDFLLNLFFYYQKHLNFDRTL